MTERQRKALFFVGCAMGLSWSYWGVLLALGWRVEASGGMFL